MLGNVILYEYLSCRYFLSSWTQTGVLHSQWIPVLWVQINHEQRESDYWPGNAEDEERGFEQSGGRCSVHHDTTVI